MKANTIAARLLVVDRDTRYGAWLKHHLAVLCPESAVSMLTLNDFERWSTELSRLQCDVLMLAASFGSGPEDPQAKGIELLRRLRKQEHFPAVIAVAEEGNELTAVRALQLGAVDYLPKRLLTPDRLKTSVRLALRMLERRVARRIANLAQAAEAGSKSGGMRDSRAADAEGDTRTAASAGNGAARPDTSETVDFPAARRAAAHARIADDSEATTVAHSTRAVHSTRAAGSAGATNSTPDTDSAHDTSSARETRSTKEPDSAIDAESTSEPKSPLDGKSAARANSAAAAGLAKKDSTPIPPAAKAPGGEFMPADFIPGYTIHATIGESEKAAVYVATSAARGENVALKVSKTLRDEAAGRQFLEREYTAILAIRDPSVAQIYDYGVHAGYEYLVMEYLPRGDLKARMQQGLTEQETLRYVSQIAAALQVVHEAGLLHRDLKPPNVMLRENGDITLIDFGLARALDGSTPSTRTGVLRGSPYYMSPEQAMGEVLDARSDFYSLGIMYYEMLTGRKPYTGGSAMEVLQQHVHAPLPIIPRTLACHEPLLLKLLAKSREDRFATAGEIVFAIAAQREIIQAAGVGAPIESSAA